MTISKLVKKAKRGNKEALVQLILQQQQQVSMPSIHGKKSRVKS